MVKIDVTCFAKKLIESVSMQIARSAIKQAYEEMIDKKTYLKVDNNYDQLVRGEGIVDAKFDFFDNVKV